jgi:hypothetical protein
MMGRREDGQGQFFYSFDLDKVVPPDHLVRQIDSLLDLSWVHEELAPYYSHTGRPSIDPVLMIRMLLVGYIFAIGSERRICAEIQVNLAYRWFCKLGAAMAMTIYLCYRFAHKIIAVLGPRGTNVMMRLSAFILLCIGIQILWEGWSELGATVH